MSEAPVRILRTLRLDGSDAVIFPTAASADEVAVVGSFRFWDLDPAGLRGREAQAFRAGFLGLDSWGFSTLAVVAAASEAVLWDAQRLLAARLVEHLGAPSLDATLPAAREELDFARSLADGHPPGTVIAMTRDVHDGAIRERFRTLVRRANTDRPDWAQRPVIGFVEIGSDEEVAEPVDLADLLSKGPP